MKPRIKSMIWNIRKENQSIGTRKKNPKNEDSVRNLWHNLKHSNTHIIRVPEEKRKSQKLKLYLKK